MRLSRTIALSIGGVWGDEPSGGVDDVPVVRVADFDYANLTVHPEVRTVRSVPLAARVVREIVLGDILLEKSGGGARTNVGRAVVWRGKQRAVCSNFIQLLHPLPAYDSAYLTYLHRALYVRGVAAANTKQTTGIQNLDVAAYLATEVTIPNLVSQCAIADFLDARCAQIASALLTVDQTEASLWEQRGAVFERETQGAATIALRYRLSGIEQGWSPECEGRLAEHEEWGVLKVGCVNHGRFRWEEHKRLPEQMAPRTDAQVFPGDLLMSRANTRELVGSAAIVDTDGGRRLMLCDKTYRLKPARGKARAGFLALALQSRFARDQIEMATAGASSSMQNISQPVIRDIRVPDLPLSEQLRVEHVVAERSAAFAEAGAALARLRERLTEYRDALITEAVTGQLDARAMSDREMDERLQRAVEVSGA